MCILSWTQQQILDWVCKIEERNSLDLRVSYSFAVIHDSHWSTLLHGRRMKFRKRFGLNVHNLKLQLKLERRGLHLGPLHLLAFKPNNDHFGHETKSIVSSYTDIRSVCRTFSCSFMFMLAREESCALSSISLICFCFKTRRRCCTNRIKFLLRLPRF